MNVRPCESKSLCFDPSNPLSNYSTEAADGNFFFGVFWPWIDIDNPIDGNGGGNLPVPLYFANGCLSICASSLSQEDADLCAQREAFICSHSGGDTPTTFFYNALQVCNFTCADGTIYSFRVFAGSFVNTTQAGADAQAAAYACQQAGLTHICLSSIDNACYNEAYFQTVTVSRTARAPFVFSIISGSLPPGLDLTHTSPTAAVISGTPNTPGDYTFRIRVVDSRNNFMEKDYTLHVMGITNSAPAGSVGAAYSFQYTVSGGTPPYTFVIDGGNLPSGLTMSESGLISGTPTMTETANFTVSVSDSSV